MNCTLPSDSAAYISAVDASLSFTDFGRMSGLDNQLNRIILITALAFPLTNNRHGWQLRKIPLSKNTP